MALQLGTFLHVKAGSGQRFGLGQGGHSFFLDEPQKPEAGHVYGATFIRLDEETILKLRTPLNSGFEEVEKKAKLPELPGLDGMPLPPLPDGNLPLPPLPNASDALAAMKLQMDED